jgi:hypothetical protein
MPAALADTTSTVIEAETTAPPLPGALTAEDGHTGRTLHRRRRLTPAR